jgi:putative protease
MDMNTLFDDINHSDLNRGRTTAVPNSNTNTHLAVLARSMEQVDALCNLIVEGEPIHEIIVDFLEVDGMQDAVSRIRSVNARVVVASPRIIKPGEAGIWRTLLRLQPDGLLVRSTGLLNRLLELEDQGIKIPELIGDFSLNTVNVLSANELLNIGRLTRITSAYDLSANAITELAQTMGERASMLEVIVHSHLPIFHTEHCVFARFLSKGNSYLDCGHACQRHRVHLRDQNGDDNLVLADMGCRNTVFSAEAQSGLYSISEWINARVGTFRVELIDENAHDTTRIVRGYLGVISGSDVPSNAWEMLNGIRDSNGRRMTVGVGSLRNTVERRAGAL